jgi:hypothetical protein
MRSEAHQVDILEVLAAHLSADQFETILYASREIQSEEQRSLALQELAPYLPERFILTFFATLLELQEERWRTNVLLTLTENASPAIFARLLELARDIQDQNVQAQVLKALAAQLPESAFPQFWDVWQQVQSKGHSLWILVALAEHVPEAYFAPFWAATQALEMSDWQIRIVSILAEHTPERNFAQLWAAIQQNTNQEWLSLSIKTLVPHLPESFYPQVFQAALAFPITPATLHESLESGPVHPLVTLTGYVPESFFLQFWHTASKIEDTLLRALLREHLARRVPANCFAAIWQEVSTLEENQTRRESLWQELARHTPVHFFPQVWETVQTLDDAWLQAKLLVALASHVPASFLPQFWQKMQTVDDGHKVNIIYQLVPQLPSETLSEALDIVLKIPSSGMTKGLLPWMIAFLSEEQSEDFLNTLLVTHSSEDELVEAFTSMQKWRGRWREQMLLALVPRLPEARLQAILPALLKAILHNRQDDERVEVLAKLATRVSADSLPVMLEAIWSLQAAQSRRQVLNVLLPTLTPGGWIRVLELAQEKTRTTGEARYLLQVLNATPVSLQKTDPAQLYPALHDILRQLAQKPRREALDGLAFLEPALRTLGGAEAVSAAACAALEIGRWWP